MYFINVRGRKQKLKNSHKYFIDWELESRSKFQTQIKDLLFDIWGADFVIEELPVLGSRMTIDFFNVNRQIAVEVDGDQHYKYNKHFHGGKKINFLNQLKRDDEKEDFCKINGIKLVRIMSSDKISTSKQLEFFIENYEY